MSARVYLLMRHPVSPFSDGVNLKVGEVMGAYSTRAEPAQIAKKNNSGRHRYSVWSVKAKQVKA